MYFASPHRDLESLITDEDRARQALDKARLMHVTSHGDVSVEDAEILAARDLAIAEAIAGNAGLGPYDSFIFDQVAAAQRGNSFADTQPVSGTVYLSTTPRSRLGRLWDRLCRALG